LANAYRLNGDSALRFPPFDQALGLRRATCPGSECLAVLFAQIYCCAPQPAIKKPKEGTSCKGYCADARNGGNDFEAFINVTSVERNAGEVTTKAQLSS